MLIYIHISKVLANPFQRRLDYGNIEELATQIATSLTAYPDTYGIMQVPRGRIVCKTATGVQTMAPIKATVKKNGRYEVPTDMPIYVELAFGHRRHKAIVALTEQGAEGYDGWLPVMAGEMTDEQMLDAVYAENAQRKDISAIEEAELLADKLQFVTSQRELAEQWGIARPTVTNRLKLLGLPKEMQELNRRGELSERTALAMLEVVEVAKKIERAGEYTKWGSQPWELKKPESVIQEWIEKPQETTSEKIRLYYKDLQKMTGEKLAAPVTEMTCSTNDTVLMPTCSKCPYRHGEVCLKTSCLKEKLKIFYARTEQEGAKKAGLQISHLDEDYKHPNQDTANLQKSYQNGKRCPNLVTRFTTNNWTRTFWVTGKNEKEKAKIENLTQAMAESWLEVGHQGEIAHCPHCNKTDSGTGFEAKPTQTRTRPSEAQMSEWLEKSKGIVEKIQDALVSTLVNDIDSLSWIAIAKAWGGTASNAAKRKIARDLLDQRFPTWKNARQLREELEKGYPALAIQCREAEALRAIADWWKITGASRKLVLEEYQTLLLLKDDSRYPYLTEEINKITNDAAQICAERGWESFGT